MKPRIALIGNNTEFGKHIQSRLFFHSAKLSPVSGIDQLLENPEKSRYYDLIVCIENSNSPYIIKLIRDLQKKYNNVFSIAVILPGDAEIPWESYYQEGASLVMNAEVEPASMSRRIEETALRKRRFARKKILVIEDSRTIRLYTENALQRYGFTVITATDGREALALLPKIMPDLIITDINMPRMDGREFIKHIKQTEATRNIPFIIVSSNTEKMDFMEFKAHGAFAYLLKPIVEDELIVLVDKIFSTEFQFLIAENWALEQEKDSLLQTLFSLSKALEARDNYTRGHSQSVAETTRRLMKAYGAPDEEIDTVTLGAYFHDLGKIGIPDNILNKPGKLTEEEYMVMKSHPVLGVDILKPIKGFASFSSIVRNHHERWDGTGYPDRLKGDEIPMWTRMLTAADIYDALTSDRPYRKGMSHENAIEIIKEESGRALCPEIVELFLKVMDT